MAKNEPEVATDYSDYFSHPSIEETRKALHKFFSQPQDPEKLRAYEEESKKLFRPTPEVGLRVRELPDGTREVYAVNPVARRRFLLALEAGFQLPRGSLVPRRPDGSLAPLPR